MKRPSAISFKLSVIPKRELARACSSVGQSTRLISVGSEVQIFPGPPRGRMIAGFHLFFDNQIEKSRFRLIVIRVI